MVNGFLAVSLYSSGPQSKTTITDCSAINSKRIGAKVFLNVQFQHHVMRPSHPRIPGYTIWWPTASFSYACDRIREWDDRGHSRDEMLMSCFSVRIPPDVPGTNQRMFGNKPFNKTKQTHCKPKRRVLIIINMVGIVRWILAKYCWGYQQINSWTQCHLRFSNVPLISMTWIQRWHKTLHS